MEDRELAAQLRCPNGADAAEVAGRMNEANRSLNHKCIDLLQIFAADRILEIGPSNGAFVDRIVNKAAEVHYTGLDWSADMVAEAGEANAGAVTSGSARFLQGSSDSMPFEEASFDKALTVHTLYFWETPTDHLAEVRRVLNPGGLFCIAFGDLEFMQHLPFVPYGFRLYDAILGQELLRSSGFDVLEFQQHRETEVGNTGEEVEKIINIALCQRC
ncbi:class I SAM-dependent methyltransferase [Microbulbifer litoralis]|uniref:class I SAM-dependent methyltransferase n=1 Tax=Microbulbifer litoralis TaxID=2933965 RepID=UPI00202889F7|nr:class I SAM-dependent methyltransferase [Microbulbifer sp. GX H0434]